MKPANPSVAIVGYGRFGRALAGLFLDAGIVVRAFDSRESVPAHLAATSLQALVVPATHIVLAVPISEIRHVIAEIAPLVDSSQIVLDVGSVKLGPIRAFAELLADRIPWVGTHPLFGPTSLALAERPLRVVVCPNPLHPDAAIRVAALYRAIGCDVLEESADLHDQRMAETHALAFFVAKGVLDANIGLDVPYAPPSFQAIARIVEVVRSDAGHLFAAIERENPHASAVRKRYIDALIDIDARLSNDGPLGAAISTDSTRLAISPPSAVPPELRETRDLIDDLDREIVALLGRRMQLAQRAYRVKTRLGLGIVDSVRESELLEKRKAWAVAEGLDAATIDEIFDAVLRTSRRLQQRD